MKRVFFLILAAGMIMVSCKKDETTIKADPTAKSDFMQLKIGNYWVYHKIHIDATGSESPPTVDSLLIIDDTLIRGNKYYKKVFVGHEHVTFLRDSGGYLVDHKGKVIFSDHDFSNVIRTDTIGPGLALAQYRMFDPDTLIQVTYGTFEVLEFRGEITALDPQSSHGTQYTHYYYSEGIGMVKNSCYYYNDPDLKVEQRLVNFGNILEE
jgi:hypothetical protein